MPPDIAERRATAFDFSGFLNHPPHGCKILQANKAGLRIKTPTGAIFEILHNEEEQHYELWHSSTTSVRELVFVKELPSLLALIGYNRNASERFGKTRLI